MGVVAIILLWGCPVRRGSPMYPETRESNCRRHPGVEARVDNNPGNREIARSSPGLVQGPEHGFNLTGTLAADGADSEGG